VLAIVLVATFMQLLDATIVNVAVPAVRLDLAATPGQIQLVLAGYQLAFACSLLVGGRLGDTYGRRRIFLMGMVGFVVASAACGLARDGSELVAGRLLQGACSGLMFPQVLSIIQVGFAPKDKPKAFGRYGATLGLATVLGPLIGGVLLDPLGLSWRSVFWVNVPVGVLAIVAGARMIPETRAPEAQRVHVPSVVLATAGLFLLVCPLVVGRDQDWPWWTFVAMAAAVPVLGVFALWQARLERSPGGSPLVSPALFADRTFTVGLVLNLVFFTGIGPFFFIFILTMQSGLGTSAIVAGLATLPFAVMGAVASGRSAGLAGRLGPRILLIGCILLVVGHSGVVLTLHLGGPDVWPVAFAPALAVAGFGMGMFVAPVTNLVLAGVRPRNAGAASGIIATAQQVGGAAGIAFLGVIFFTLLGTNADHVATDAVPALHQRMVEAGVSGDTTGIEQWTGQCFHDRVTADDPSRTPASCRALASAVSVLPDPQQRAAAARVVMVDTLPHLRQAGFTRTLEQSIYWEIAVFAISGVLVRFLPRPRPAQDGGTPAGPHPTGGA
jgi:EmrB/QacA subfamily drug resistance transporter